MIDLFLVRCFGKVEMLNFLSTAPLEWRTGMYKHLDHHLKQFGV